MLCIRAGYSTRLIHALMVRLEVWKEKAMQHQKVQRGKRCRRDTLREMCIGFVIAPIRAILSKNVFRNFEMHTKEEEWMNHLHGHLFSVDVTHFFTKAG